MKVKKITAILISTLVVFGLAACGNQSAQNSQSSQNSASETQSVSGNTAPESSQEVSGQEVSGIVEQETIAQSSEMVTDDISTEALTEEQEENNNAEPADEGGKTLVVYYSATGTTANVADYIAAATNADIFELEPADPYSSDDLNWTDDNSRVVYEHDNPDARKVELVAATVDDWESYDTVFIGYPIWWHIAAWPVDGFIAANDFTGKTVIPFCTSSSSGLGESGELLEEAAGTGNWLAGERFSSGASEADIQAWVESLGL